MSVIKIQKRERYSSISNSILNDPRISFKAKGLLCYLLGKPDDWTCRVQDLYNHSWDGFHSVRSGIKELVLAGYMELRNDKNDDGTYTGRYYLVYERPLIEEGYRKEQNKNKRFKEGEELVYEKPKKTFGN